MFAPIEQLVPHRAPLLWVNELIACTDTTATATARFSNDHFAADNQQLIETALVESMAQTVAAALGQRRRAQGAGEVAQHGMLAGISNFKILARPPLNETLTIEVWEVKRLGPMLMVGGRISCGANVIATGELSLYA